MDLINGFIAKLEDTVEAMKKAKAALSEELPDENESESEKMSNKDTQYKENKKVEPSK